MVTDASQIVVGGVLMQDCGEGLKPLVFLSKQLKPTKQWYSVYEHKLVVVVYCFLAWQHYLEGYSGGVVVIIDHQTLTRIMDQQALSRLRYDRNVGVYFNPFIQPSSISRAKQTLSLMPSVEVKEELQMRMQKIKDFTKSTRKTRTQCFH